MTDKRKRSIFFLAAGSLVIIIVLLIIALISGWKQSEVYGYHVMEFEYTNGTVGVLLAAQAQDKFDAIMYADTGEVYYKLDAWLVPRELSIPTYVMKVGNVIGEQLKEGTLPEFLEEHVSDYRELSSSEIWEKVVSDKVLKQYYIKNQPDDQWFCMEGSEDIWILQSRELDGTSYWQYYKFPYFKDIDGYDASLNAGSPSEEYFFFAWESIDYLVTICRDEKGDITEVSTHYMLSDPDIYGWILRQTIEENGEITVECLDYWAKGYIYI